MTTSPPRPNFFLLLGLNPNATWNQSQFEQVLKEKINQWARDSSGVARKALTAKTYRALIPKIREVMADPELRKQEADTAKTAMAQDNQAKQEQFEQQLSFINAKDSITEEEITKIVDAFKDILSAKEIRSRIKPEIISSSATPTKTIRPLDTSLAKNISDLLQIVHMSSLYELLERTNKTATPELYRAAEALYTRMVRLPPNADVTVKSQLAGLARDVFKSHEMRTRYDETLRLASLHQQLKELDDFIRISKDKELNVNQIQIFLAKAQAKGWKEQEAFEQLKEHARQRKWILTAPKIEAEQKIFCPNCESLNDRKQRFCTKCKRELLIKCPRCETELSSEFIACGTCGFAIGNRYLVDNWLEEIPNLIKTDQLQQAQEHVEEIETAWQTGKNDPRTQQLRSYKETINKLYKTRQQAESQFEKKLQQLIQQKQYFAARQLLAGRNEPSSRHDAHRRKIDETIRQAQDLFKHALDPSVRRENKAELCRQALALCTDYQQARDLLKTMPPAPARNLRATIQNMTVNLSWNASTTSEATYKIIRKSHSRPNAMTDGKTLETVTGLTYADSTPEIGVPLYYAIYAIIDDITSAQATLTTQPVQIIQDVTQATVQVNNQQVTISWNPPPHVHTVTVVRKAQTPPTSALDGQQLGEYPSTQKYVIDRNVQETKTYYYRIICQFKDANGQILLTQGIVVRAIPEVPPSPPGQLEIIETDRNIRISWPPPQKGSVVIIKSSQALNRKGQILSESQLSSLGQCFTTHQHHITDTWKPATLTYYTPAIVFQHAAYIGSSQRYVGIDNVRNLTHQQNLDSAIRLRWIWPENCQEAYISYSTTQGTQHNVPPAVTQRISRAEYDHLGYVDIHGMHGQEYDILVSAVINYQGEKVIAHGARVITRLTGRVILTYEIKQPHLLRKKRRLLITADKPALFPALLLVSKQGDLPFRKSDGDLFHRIEPVATRSKELSIDLPDQSTPVETFGKLFMEDDSMYNEVIIHHPGKKQLRLG